MMGVKLKLKIRKIRAAHIITIVCFSATLVLLCFLFNDVLGIFGETTGNGTIFEIRADSTVNNGFDHETIVYTEDGTTNITFTGNITTNGTAEISLLSEEGIAVYSQSFTNVNSKKINIEISGLTPQTYYILRFLSDDAKQGHLYLTTEQALVERPEIPERSARPPR